MCQLLGMNCNTPTDIGFSFAGFRRRGGMTDSHEDGFGIAFFERSECANSHDESANASTGLRLFHDNRPSHLSPVADLVNNYPIKAMNVIAHIRKATQGQNCLANTHPFVREVWGEQWVFAHNGQMNSEFIKRCQRLQDAGADLLANMSDAELGITPESARHHRSNDEHAIQNNKDGER